MQVYLANPRGFCAGVDRAILIVRRALEYFGAPIYVRHEVVHNRIVVDELSSLGAVFTDDLDDVPDGSILIFSAHGVSQAVRHQAKIKGCKVFDATCPLVTKVHMEVARYAKRNYECILIGHEGHPEVEGTMGQYDNVSAGIYLVESIDDVAKLRLKNPKYCAYSTQTTLSADDATSIISALKEKFPDIIGPKNEDICYATQNRQDSVKKLAELADVVIVVGSVTSSNSNRLKELADEYPNCTAYLVDHAGMLQQSWFEQSAVVGVTAGASAPEKLVQGVLSQLQQWGGSVANELEGVEEPIVFVLPKELRDI